MNSIQREICENLWNEYEPQLRKICRVKLRSCPDEVDDVMSEVSLALCKQIEKLETHKGGKVHDYYCNGWCRFHRQQLYLLYVKRTSTGSHRMSGFPDLCGQPVHARTGDGAAKFSFCQIGYLRSTGHI